MEKEFDSYEHAIALRELGFDEPCLGYYTHNTGIEMNKLALTRHPKRNINSDISWGNKLYEGDVTAPLKQQVFRWFREKYEVYPTLMTETADDSLYFRFIVEGGPEWLSFSKIYYTYEEAENACIDKLIELAKQS